MTPPKEQLPRAGELEPRSLPGLLISLEFENFDGSLHLRRERFERRFVFQAGAPVYSESNLRSETLGAHLLAEGTLSQENFRKASEYAKARGCGETAAFLALDLLDSRTLLAALKGQLSTRLVDCFGWREGQFELREDTQPNPDLDPLRSDLASLIQQGLAAHWSIERMLESLSGQLDLYPTPGRDLTRWVSRLIMSSEQSALLLSLDGRRPLRIAMGTTALGSRQALAALLVIDASRALEYSPQPPPSTEKAAPEFEFEFTSRNEEVADASAGPGAETNQRKPSRQSESGRARELIVTRSAELADLDHYQLLELDAAAPSRAVKKAYIKAAKSFHPDTLARLGLEDLRDDAARIFSKISSAYEILSDPVRRRDYDASLRGDVTESEAQTLSQAESAYRKGEILLKMGNFREALDYLRAAVNLWPREAVYRSALGWALHKSTPADVESAREELEQALSLDADDPTAHFRLAMILRSLGEEESSGHHLERSKALSSGKKSPG